MLWTDEECYGREVSALLLAILAVEEVAHSLPSGLVRLSHRLAFVGVHTALRYGIRRFGGAALRTAIGKAGFVWPEFEFFPANDTGFYRKRHNLHDIAA